MPRRLQVRSRPELEALLRDELARLDHRIRSARNREKRFHLHGYSRLLDLERLLYLLRLLSTYTELSAADPTTRAELEAIVSPGRVPLRGVKPEARMP